MTKKTGVLLVNLGTPNSPKPKDVKNYLIEFLTDGRVIDIPWLQRQLLVRGLIVPRRYRDSAKNYERIWTDQGSPLKIYGEKVSKALQEELGDQYHVELAMRYQQPSIGVALEKLRGCETLKILPLFPQYASATTGSVFEKVMQVMQKWTLIPELRLIKDYPTHPLMIDAFCERAKIYPIASYDHILFSFHGLPERQLKKADRNGCCLCSSSCCQRFSEKNRNCYSAQCHATAQSIAKNLQLQQEQYSISFQSRLGKEPWIQPYTLETIDELLKGNKKKILVFSPAFVADCLETIDEIGREYREHFISQGGIKLDLVPALNDHPLWIKALKELVQ